MINYSHTEHKLYPNPEERFSSSRDNMVTAKQFNSSQLETKMEMNTRQQNQDQGWQTELIIGLEENFGKSVMEQKHGSISKETQLFANISTRQQGEFNFEQLPPPYPYSSDSSRLINTIYQKKGDQKIQKHFRNLKKKQLNRKSFESTNTESTLSSKPIIINPREINNKSFDSYSKSQRTYSRQYKDVLEDYCFQEGYNKPMESGLCVENYIYSQICPSGLATHQFLSLNAKRRLSLIGTQSTHFKEYPFTPRTLKQLQQIKQRVNCARTRVERAKLVKDKQFNEYEEMFIKDNSQSTDKYLKAYLNLKQKKSKVYGSRLEQIQDVAKYMQADHSEINTAYDIVKIIHDKRRQVEVPIQRTRKSFKLDDNEFLNSRQVVQKKRLYLRQAHVVTQM